MGMAGLPLGPLEKPATGPTPVISNCKHVKGTVYVDLLPWEGHGCKETSEGTLAGDSEEAGQDSYCDGLLGRSREGFIE
jgi:hypothetical protein